jgi:hypothetical protein
LQLRRLGDLASFLRGAQQLRVRQLGLATSGDLRKRVPPEHQARSPTEHTSRRVDRLSKRRLRRHQHHRDDRGFVEQAPELGPSERPVADPEVGPDL